METWPLARLLSLIYCMVLYFISFVWKYQKGNFIWIILYVFNSRSLQEKWSTKYVPAMQACWFWVELHLLQILPSSLLHPEIDFHSMFWILFFVLSFVQHVPRINGEIPSIDEATLDHQRLLERYHVLFFHPFKSFADTFFFILCSLFIVRSSF